MVCWQQKNPFAAKWGHVESRISSRSCEIIPLCINTQDWLVSHNYGLNSDSWQQCAGKCMYVSYHWSYNHHCVASVKTHSVNWWQSGPHSWHHLYNTLNNATLEQCIRVPSLPSETQGGCVLAHSSRCSSQGIWTLPHKSTPVHTWRDISTSTLTSLHTIQYNVCVRAYACVVYSYVGGTYVRTYVCACVHLHRYSCPGDVGARGCWQLQVTLGYAEHANEMLHITIHRNDLISMTQVKGHWPI